MKYEAITPVQVFMAGNENEIYMLTKVTGTLTLDEIRNAEGFVVPIEEPTDPVPIDDPEPAPEEPKKRKSTVDHDKIVALDASGWSVAEIAREIGCSEQTVRNHLKSEADV